MFVMLYQYLITIANTPMWSNWPNIINSRMQVKTIHVAQAILFALTTTL
jgi:hypothetical protein